MSKIYQNARRFNIDYEFTGFIAFVKGIFILIVEGENEAVKEYYHTARHQEICSNIDVVLYTEVVKQYFAGHSLRLSCSPESDIAFNSFVESNLCWFNEISIERKQQLNQFYTKQFLTNEPVLTNEPITETNSNTNDAGYLHTQQQETIKQVSSVEHFKGQSLRLSAWPDFTQISPVPATVELCAKLLTAAYDYEELVSNTKFAEKEEVDTLLQTFDELALLQCTPTQNKQEALANQGSSKLAFASAINPSQNSSILETKNKKVEKNKGSFYQKMRKFLSLN